MIIKKIPFKALGIFILGILIGVYLGSRTTVKAITKIFDSESVSKSMNKPTNQNNTSIEFKDNKFKKTDSLTIDISQEPKTKQVTKSDSCSISLKDFNKLSDSQKNRLKRWVK